MAASSTMMMTAMSLYPGVCGSQTAGRNAPATTAATTTDLPTRWMSGIPSEEKADRNDRASTRCAQTRRAILAILNRGTVPTALRTTPQS